MINKGPIKANPHGKQFTPNKIKIQRTLSGLLLAIATRSATSEHPTINSTNHGSPQPPPLKENELQSLRLILIILTMFVGGSYFVFDHRREMYRKNELSLTDWGGTWLGGIIGKWVNGNGTPTMQQTENV